MLNILTDISGNKEAYKQYGLQIKEEIDHLISLSVHKDKPKILLIGHYHKSYSFVYRNHQG